MKILSLLGLTAFATFLNAAKPIVVDDQVYYAFAVHIAAHPLDPYGFVYGLRPAIETLAPPGLLYWLAVARNLFGPEPFALKLSLLPFVALFVWSSYRLATRFAPAIALPLTVMLVLSPTVLPNWNLMLDMPALALGLTALNLFMFAREARSPRAALLLAIAAGLVAGLASETKYTAFVALAAIGWYGLVQRRIGLASLAGLAAVVVFVGVEAWFAALYGTSHFLLHLSGPTSSFVDRAPKLVLRLLSLLGALSCWLLPLSLAVLGARPRWVIASAILATITFPLVAILPTAKVLSLPPATWLYGLDGVIAAAASIAIVVRLARSEGALADKRDDLFLLGWLGLQIVGFFTMFPFAAAARLIWMLFVSTLVVARLYARSARQPAAWVVPFAASACAAIGVLFALVDLRDGVARKDMGEAAAAWILQRDPSARIYALGYGGFTTYGLQAGMRLLEPGDTFKSGDWIAADQTVSREAMSRMKLVETLTAQDSLPLRTMPEFYFGGSPMVRLEGPRASADIYRVP